MSNVVVLSPEQLEELIKGAVRDAVASVHADGPDVMTRSDAADFLKMSEHQVTKLHGKGMPGHKLGGHWRFRKSEILAWMAKQNGDR